MAIRGLPVLVHEQSNSHHCPIQIERRVVEDSTDTPLPLLTTFLSSSILRPEDPETGQPLETLRLRLLSLRKRDGLFSFRDRLEQTEDWQDILVVDIVPAAVAGALPDAWATWNSSIPRAIRTWATRPEDQLTDIAPDVPDFWRGSIALPEVVRPLLGERAAVQLTVVPQDGRRASLTGARLVRKNSRWPGRNGLQGSYCKGCILQRRHADSCRPAPSTSRGRSNRSKCSPRRTA